MSNKQTGASQKSLGNKNTTRLETPIQSEDAKNELLNIQSDAVLNKDIAHTEQSDKLNSPTANKRQSIMLSSKKKTGKPAFKLD